MNNKELKAKVQTSMYRQIKDSNMASPMQVLMDIGVLSKEDYHRWRFGEVDYLERVCKCNLSKLSTVMEEVRVFAKSNDLKPSYAFYKMYGRKNKPPVKLRFSKSGKEFIETSYATHYISQRLVEQRKKEKMSDIYDTIFKRES